MVNIFKTLFFSKEFQGDFYIFSAKCNRCGEVIPGKIHIYNDPGMGVDKNGANCLVCRKVLIGNEHCYQPIEVIFRFDEGRRVIEREITGGEFIKG
jgi:hypothetical protein